MPWTSVMPQFQAGSLQSGSGKPVRSRKQAIAIMLSEKAKAAGNPEYAAPKLKKLKMPKAFYGN